MSDTMERFSHPKVRPTSAANALRLVEMLEVIEALRAPDGCPWDGEQTHRTLRPYLLEETHELLEAIDSGDDEETLEELGDVLLQVFMHHAIAQEEGRFAIADVAKHATAKMINRHPHVFGDTEAATAEQVLSNWEGLKRKEARKQGRLSALEGAPKSLPALAWALSIQKRAARVGFDWADTEGVLEKIAEEARELAAESTGQRQEEELGDLLFSLVNLARRLRINPEDALRGSSNRFYRRFEAMEQAARDEGRDVRDMTPEELDALWGKVKGTEA
ncbi:MAG: nucleoside triphosphate pyrophosphohydrolase [Candidatus Dormibacteria bacterium]